MVSVVRVAVYTQATSVAVAKLEQGVLVRACYMLCACA